MGDENKAYAMNVVNALRDAGIAAAPYLDANKKFKNQMEYADKIMARYAVIIGGDEVANNVMTVKDMVTGTQQTQNLNDTINLLKNA